MDPQMRMFWPSFLRDPPSSVNVSPLPCGVSLPLQGGASPPWRRRLQIDSLKLIADLVTK